KVCQHRYEVMVADRSSRDGKSAADLRELRLLLRRQIAAYCGALGSMYMADPSTGEVVEDALRPILIARARARRKELGLPEEDEPNEAEESKIGEKVDADLAEPKAEESDDEGEGE
ncbi:MAG TPA: hypothetical protein VM869_03430, partial [Enhygromyxa sp.]|nr:hypothetical protein [Enhygromyxa sp.]